jgi:hypothetical protein
MNPSEPDPKTNGGDLPPASAPDSVEPVPVKKKPRLSLGEWFKPRLRLREWFVLFLVLGLLAAIAIPNFVNARTTACKGACIANLKQIDGAVMQWALEYKKTTNDVPEMRGVVEYLKGSVLPVCPAGGSYHLGKTVGAPPTCSGNRDGNDGHRLQP